MIKPNRGYVLIEPEPADEKTASGFYVPDNSKEKPEKGTAVAVGETSVVTGQDKTMTDGLEPTYQDPPCLKGDKVFYKKWAGTEVKDDGKEYVFVRFEDVLGVIE